MSNYIHPEKTNAIKDRLVLEVSQHELAGVIPINIFKSNDFPCENRKLTEKGSFTVKKSLSKAHVYDWDFEAILTLQNKLREMGIIKSGKLAYVMLEHTLSK